MHTVHLPRPVAKTVGELVQNYVNGISNITDAQLNSYQASQAVQWMNIHGFSCQVKLDKNIDPTATQIVTFFVSDSTAK